MVAARNNDSLVTPFSTVIGGDFREREGFISYDEFTSSTYSEEMKRRYDYYMGNQFMFDPAVVASDGARGPSPATWNAAWSGFGWADIRTMLPEIIENQCIHPVGIRFVNVVVDNRQVVYTVPPDSRQVFFGEKEDTEASRVLNAVYSACGHDLKADQLCKWTGLFDTAFQFVGWDAYNDVPVKRNLRPFEVYVAPAFDAPGDIQHPDCLVAIAQKDQGITLSDRWTNEIVWQVWHEDRFWYEKQPGMAFSDRACTKRGTNPNPYRDNRGRPVKPIIVTHSGDTEAVYYTGSDDLVIMNQRLDRLLTGLSYTMEYQGFAIPVATGLDPEQAATQPWSPGGLWCLPDPQASLQFVHPATQMGEFLGATVKMARVFARMESIDPELVDPEVKAQSGVSKAHGRRALAERREEQFPKWIPYEREAYWITSIVWNYHKADGLPELPVVDRFDGVILTEGERFHLEVVFGELDPVVDPLAEAYENITKLKANLITRADIIAAERRVPAEVAEKMADEIKKMNEKDGIVSDFNPASVRVGQSGNRPTNMSRPADKTGSNVSGFSGNQSVEGDSKRN